MPIDINEEILSYYVTLLKKGVEDLYRGHEDYIMIKEAITAERFMGGDVLVKKRNPRDGTYRTVRYRVPVFDDLGYPLLGVEDLGGRCVSARGEIAHKDHIFRCMECNRLFCERHIKFFDYDQQYPLCTVGRPSCFSKYEKIHYKSEELKLKALIARREQELGMAIGDRFQALRYAKEEQYALEDLQDSRPGFFDKLFGLALTYGAITCPRCSWSPNSCDATCQSCGHVFRLKAGSPRLCPYCNTVVKEIHCIRCNNTIST